MTNPNDALGTNAALSGRTSIAAFNDCLTVYSRGIMSGWEVNPSSGMTVAAGGIVGVRDVAIAADPNGARTTINNRSLSPILVTIPAAPASNSRIDAVVAYVDASVNGQATVVDNPDPCGILVVSGTAAANPTAPSDNDIRTAITADGAAGATAYYVVLAEVTVASGTTDITSGEITQGKKAGGSVSIDLIYPVGSYYETSDTSFDPNVAWLGTTWVEDTAGRVLVAYENADTDFGTVGNTGGEKKHTLTTTEMPKHGHTIGANALWTQLEGYGNVNPGDTPLANRANTRNPATDDAGGGNAHNNLQPYIVVKRWHRTA